MDDLSAIIVELKQQKDWINESFQIGFVSELNDFYDENLSHLERMRELMIYGRVLLLHFQQRLEEFGRLIDCCDADGESVPTEEIILGRTR